MVIPAMEKNSKIFVQVFTLISLIKLINGLPNFVLILTDDQDLLLNGMLPMKNTIKLVADKGKTFENAYANTPICCPSRSSMLTGKYPHNTGVVNNTIAGNCSSRNWQNYHEPHTLPAILRREKGYVTFYAGKYLNRYGYGEVGGTKHVPEGYDWWIGLKGNSRYYNYTLSINGTGVHYVDDYLTDVLADHSLKFLDNKPQDKPFFMMIAPPASHAPFTPAERHQDEFPDMKALRNPSFNHTSSDKHWIVRMPPSYLPENVSILDDIQRHRLESLLSVDEIVKHVTEKLAVLNQLNNTYIIFTSDNGFHIGQFSQPWDKRQPYETDIRIPLIISGPNIPAKSLESYPVSLLEVTPTILDLAGIDAPTDLDGRSFKKQLLRSTVKRFKKLIFVEYSGESSPKTIDSGCPWTYDRTLAQCSLAQWCKCQDSRNNTYTCLLDIGNSQKFKFCHFEDNENFKEAYNLTADQYELDNLVGSLSSQLLEDYENILNQFKSCRGKMCLLELN